MISMLSIYKQITHNLFCNFFRHWMNLHHQERERERMVVQGNEQKTMTYKSHVRGQN